MRWAWVHLLGGLLLLLGGCGETQTPEDRVRQFVSELEAHAEQRSWLAFDASISDTYRDRRGLDKRAVLALIARYLIAHQRIHILTRVPVVTIDREEPLRARAVVYAALAGQPIADAEALSNLRAEIYRFELQIAEEEGTLRVIEGRWQPVPAANFLLGT